MSGMTISSWKEGWGAEPREGRLYVFREMGKVKG
jgi:hypothetical protein